MRSLKYLRAILYYYILLITETVGDLWVQGGLIKKIILTPLFILSLTIVGCIAWLHDGDKSEDIL